MVKLPRSTGRYRPRAKADESALRAEIRTLAAVENSYGYRRITAALKRHGHQVNAKRIQRIWQEEGLQVPRRKVVKRRAGPLGEVKLKATKPNQVWSYDFIEDRTERGQRIRILGIVDEYTRECLALYSNRSVPAAAVVAQLEWLMIWRGMPDHVRSDNGPEFIAKKVRHWLREHACDTIFITPGSPWENPYIESFFDKLRGEYLNQTLFPSIQEAQSLLESWRQYYNEDRLHSPLSYQTPLEFATQFDSSKRLLPPVGEVEPESVDLLSLKMGE